MAKDAKGHGSDKRGGSLLDKVDSLVSRISPIGMLHDTTWNEGHGGADRAAADKLGQGHSKSDPVPVHLNAWGQTPSTAKAVRSQLRMGRKMQLNKPPSKRRSYP